MWEKLFIPLKFSFWTVVNFRLDEADDANDAEGKGSEDDGTNK